MSQPTRSRTRPVVVPVPSGLSPWAGQVWAELQEFHCFAAHELIALERSLAWWDRADTALRAADGTSGADAATWTKLAIDCSSTALRHWRTLKFPAPAGVRAPGRPSGVEWSRERKAAAVRGGYA